MRQEIFYTFFYVLYVIYAFLCIPAYCFSFLFIMQTSNIHM